MTRRKPVLRDAGAVLLLWLLVVLFTWPIGLGGRVLAGGDIFTYFYPYWAEATRAIRGARLPLWNPFLFMGVPFVANSQVGFFYPLNWILWLAFPAHQSVHVTILLHLCLAALNAYLWGRGSLNLGQLGAWCVGVVFALGGYLGAQIEHVNQLQGLAWLPLVLMLYDRATDPQLGVSRRRSSTAGVAFVLGLVLLAGHTQTAFISLIGLVVYGCGPAIWRAVWQGEAQPLVRRILPLVVAVVVGISLAGAQLVPTWELSRHSVRAEGLPLNERVSFSLAPQYVGSALLPRYFSRISPDHIEHVAHVGVTGIALAVVGLALTAVDRREGPLPGLDGLRSSYLPALLLTILGLFFALGLYNPVYLVLAAYVPGFSHFRVPARWLALYGVGVSALAGCAVQAFWERRHVSRRTTLVSGLSVSVLIVWAATHEWWSTGGDPEWLTVIAWVVAAGLVFGVLLTLSRVPRLLALGLLTALVAELFLATKALPITRATASQAFTSFRPALAHLVKARAQGPGPGDRFLSMSDTTFDPGDLLLSEAIFGPQLSDDQFYRYVIAAKEKEIATPNLPLAFGVPAVDGYDGGVLPLERFVTLQRLLLAPHEVSMDGRLRENLVVVPDGRWLNLFNVRFLITDKLRDVWIDDVFYDLQHGARLSGGEEAQVAHVPRFESTTLSLVSYVEGIDQLPDGSPVGLVTLEFKGDVIRTFELRLGDEVSRENGAWGEEERALTRVHWSEPAVPLAIAVHGTLLEGSWVVRGATLVDGRTGSFEALVVSDRGRFRMVHSGDVKIYENLDSLPRAFVVPSGRTVDSDEAALRVMQDPTFDPSAEVVLQRDGGLCELPAGDGSARPVSAVGLGEPGLMDATIVEYHPERVIIDAALSEPGYLVLTDSWYPGWQVTVDGEPDTVCRADLLFRAVPLNAGEQRVVFHFRPRTHGVGAGLSVLGLALLVVGPALALRRRP